MLLMLYVISPFMRVLALLAVVNNTEVNLCNMISISTAVRGRMSLLCCVAQNDSAFRLHWCYDWTMCSTFRFGKARIACNGDERRCVLLDADGLALGCRFLMEGNALTTGFNGATELSLNHLVRYI